MVLVLWVPLRVDSNIAHNLQRTVSAHNDDACQGQSNEEMTMS